MPNFREGLKKWKQHRSGSADDADPEWRGSPSPDRHPSPGSVVHLNNPKALTTNVSHVVETPVFDTNIKPTRPATDFRISSRGSVGNESNLSLSTGAPTPAAHTSQTIWDEALENLTPKQQGSFSHCNFSMPTDSRELINAVRSKQVELGKLSWPSHSKLGNRIFNVEKLMENVINWVDRFKSIGDIIAQYDPTHIALPWAGIRFLLQVGFDNTSIDAINLSKFNYRLRWRTRPI